MTQARRRARVLEIMLLAIGFVVANASFAAQDWKAAATLYQVAIRANPDDPQVPLAGIHWLEALIEMQRYDEMPEITNHLLALPVNATGPSRHQLLAIRAKLILWTIREMAGATDLDAVKRMIALPPRDPEALERYRHEPWPHSR